MTNRTVTENDIVWEIVDEKTGEARRLTPLSKTSALRTPGRVVRYFPPEATQGPVDQSLPASIRNIVTLGMFYALLNGVYHKSIDGAKRWLDAAFPDVAAELRAEVLAMYDKKRWG